MTRFELASSSLGDYFGVGFLPPLERLEIDLGEKESVVFPAQQNAMNLGKLLENPTLNYFESLLGVTIYDRNTERLSGFEDKLHGYLDGMTLIDGEPAVVECKISQKDFTVNKGYLFQVQSYMAMTGTRRAVLLGLYQGKAKYAIIDRDNDMIKDIEEMVECVHSILNGIADRDTFRWDLVEKYQDETAPKELVQASEDKFNDNVKFIDRYGVLKREIDELTQEKKEIEEHLKITFEGEFFKKDNYSISVGKVVRKGSINTSKITYDYPDLDLEKYRDDPSEYLKLTVKV